MKTFFVRSLLSSKLQSVHIGMGEAATLCLCDLLCVAVILKSAAWL